MAVYVNTNVSSLNGRRYLNNVQNQLTTTYQRLSSGMRINSAKDDAAGLQIADRLTTQINGLNQGNRNTNDGIALSQTIEGALDETTNMLQRIRTLAVQAANGTNTAEDRKALQQEVTSLSHEITRIAKQTTFAGATVLNGKQHLGNAAANAKNSKSMIPSGGSLIFQVGANAGDTLALLWDKPFTMTGIAAQAGVKVDKTTAPTTTGFVVSDATNGKSLARWSVSSAEAATATLKTIDSFIQLVDAKRSELGAIQNHSPALLIGIDW